MQHDILTKLHNHLNNGINREADVVYLFIEIGKYLEQDKNPQFPLIRFYRNWIAHSQINDTRLAGEISTALEDALASSAAGNLPNMTMRVMEVIAKEKLCKELREFFDMAGLPKNMLDDQQLWKGFLKLLVGVLMDVPVVFTGSQRLKSLKFRKDRDSNAILCEVNGPGDTNGITFIWSQLTY